jgi:transposase
MSHYCGIDLTGCSFDDENEETDMSHYCGIDLYSNNHYVVVIDEQDKRVLEKRLSNDLSLVLEALSPYRERLQGIAVESTFNWYWLVDGLQEHGYDVRLVNPLAVKQYDGLKYSDDRHDAFHLAHLMRLGILPTGYIYPKEQRAVRDLLRRRLSLVRTASAQLISVQSQIWRTTGVRIRSADLRKPDFEPRGVEGYTLQAVAAGLAVYQAVQQEIDVLERSVYEAVKLSDDFKILQTVTGIGVILALTIMLETGSIERFAGPGNYASHACLIHVVDALQRRTGGNQVGGFNLDIGITEVDHFGAFRLDCNQADIPLVAGRGIGDFARCRISDIGDGDTEAPGQGRGHIGGDTLWLAIGTGSRNQQDIAEIYACG